VKTVLVLDDPADDPEALREFLRNHGYAARVVSESAFRQEGECNFHLRAVPGKGGSVEFDGSAEDVSEPKRVDEQLRRTNELLRAIIEAAPTPIIGLDREGRVCNVWNPAAEKMLGWSAEEVMGRMLPSVPPEKLGEFERLQEWIGQGKVLNGIEVRRRRRDGTPVEYSIYASPMRDEEGRVIGNIAVLVDITERNRVEKRVRDSLAEKEVLLKEIHHRVKNNLQVVSSLLFLQSRKIQDPELAVHFSESQNRIYSMSLAHELLYQSENLADIRLPIYVQSLVGQIEQTFPSGDKPVSCRVAVDDMTMDIEQVIPCGLLITELLSNALKHAFPGDRGGTVDVEFHRQGGSLSLTVRDDGIGLPVDLDFATAETLGVQLIRALTVQLDGTLEQERRNGTLIRVVFPARTREGSFGL
jgi:PAS domain S-box-containing protein